MFFLISLKKFFNKLIKLFKSQNPANLILLLFLSIFLWSFSLFNKNINISYFPSVLDKYLFKEFSRNFFSHLLGLIIVYISSILFNTLIKNYEILKERSNLTALLYLLLMSISTYLMCINSFLISNFIIILIILRIVSVYENPGKSYFVAFDSGFLLGIASAFQPQLIILLFFIWISFFILKTLEWRDIIISLIGFFVPYIFIYSYFFITDNLSLLNQIIEEIDLNKRSFNFEVNYINFIIILILLFFIVFGFKYFLRSININTVKTKKLINILTWLFLFDIILIFLNPINWNSISIIAIPFSFYLSILFLHTKSKLYEILFSLLLFFIILNFLYESNIIKIPLLL